MQRGDENPADEMGERGREVELGVEGEVEIEGLASRRGVAVSSGLEFDAGDMWVHSLDCTDSKRLILGQNHGV